MPKRALTREASATTIAAHLPYLHQYSHHCSEVKKLVTAHASDCARSPKLQHQGSPTFTSLASPGVDNQEDHANASQLLRYNLASPGPVPKPTVGSVVAPQVLPSSSQETIVDQELDDEQEALIYDSDPAVTYRRFGKFC
jgi:hypothetical protein